MKDISLLHKGSVIMIEYEEEIKGAVTPDSCLVHFLLLPSRQLIIFCLYFSWYCNLFENLFSS